MSGHALGASESGAGEDWTRAVSQMTSGPRAARGPPFDGLKLAARFQIKDLLQRSPQSRHGIAWRDLPASADMAVRSDQQRAG